MNNKNSYTDTGVALPAGTVIELLGQSEFFSGFTPDETSYLAGWVAAYSVPAGNFVLREGRSENCLCVLVDGTVDIYKETEPDKHLKIATIKPHESIGEMGVIDGEPFSASVITSSDSRILILTGDAFEKIIAGNEHVGVKLLRKIAGIISSRLRHTTGRLADLLANR